MRYFPALGPASLRGCEKIQIPLCPPLVEAGLSGGKNHLNSRPSAKAKSRIYMAYPSAWHGKLNNLKDEALMG